MLKSNILLFLLTCFSICSVSPPAHARSKTQKLIDQLIESLQQINSNPASYDSVRIDFLKSEIEKYRRQEIKPLKSRDFEKHLEHVERISGLLKTLAIQYENQNTRFQAIRALAPDYFYAISVTRKAMENAYRQFLWQDKLKNMLPYLQSQMAYNQAKTDLLSIMMTALSTSRTIEERKALLAEINSMLDAFQFEGPKPAGKKSEKYTSLTLEQLEQILHNLVKLVQQESWTSVIGSSFIDKVNVMIIKVQLHQKSEQKSDKLAEKLKGTEWFDRALKAEKQNEKLADYSKAIAHNPIDAAAYNNRGINLCNEGKYAEALEDYNKALSLKADFVEAYTNRGNVYSKMHQFVKARSDYDRALALDSLYAPAYYNRAHLFLVLGRYEKAIHDFQRVIMLQPENPKAFNYLGICYENSGQFDKALQSYEHAIELDSNYTAPFINKGDVYRQLKKYDLAIKGIRHALQIDPLSATAHNSLGLCYKNAGRYSAAIEEFKKAISLSPQFTAAYFNLGSVYWRLKDWDAVIEAWEKCLQINPQHKNALEWLPKAKKMKKISQKRNPN